jgi:hypothetical protein
MYLFSWQLTALHGLFKSAHRLEVPFTMDNVEPATALSASPTSRALATSMSSAWIRGQRRAGRQDSPCPAEIHDQAPRHVVAGRSPEVVSDPFGERSLWEGVPLT